MFDVGFSELMVIGVVALMVIGPQKLPGVARTVGALLGRMQRYVNDVKADINREIELDELKKMHTSVQDAAKSIETSMTDTMSGFQAQADELNKIASGDIAGLTDVSAAGSTPAAVDGAAAVADGTAAASAVASDAAPAVGSGAPAAAFAAPGAVPVAAAPVDAAALLAAVEAAPGPAAVASAASSANPVAETGSHSGAQASLALEPAPTNASGAAALPKKPALAA